jgi:hypothetical protein
MYPAFDWSLLLRAMTGISARAIAQDCSVSSRDLFRYQPKPGAEVRPLENASPVPIAATIALEVIGPMPGTVISRSQHLAE